MSNKHIAILSFLVVMLLGGCNPNAQWTTDDVRLNMYINTVSSGFVECVISTDKGAYYYVNCVPVQDDLDPVLPTNQKQFMMLALDSANLKYLQWRNQLLKDGEFNIAPFASHVLHYGETHQFFTGLKPETSYWIYAFVVNPETMMPGSKLSLITIETANQTAVNINFNYRVNGYWDYIYPLDHTGHVNANFPYIAATRDSLDIVKSGLTPVEYFYKWFDEQLGHPENIRYGVNVIENNGYTGEICFQNGHVYYTGIAAYDGYITYQTLYKFRWTGSYFKMYVSDNPTDNMFRNDQEW